MTPTSRRCAVALATAALVLIGNLLSAHDGLTEQIAAVTAQIAKNPASADLLVRRAELYREDRQRAQAFADLDRAERLEPTLNAPDLVRAYLYADAHDWTRVINASSRFLERQPKHADALILRARARVKIADARAAAADFTRALETKPSPDVYIERARALSGLGRSGIESAVAGLDEGIRRLGPIVTLELEAIEFEMRLKRYDAALARLDRVLAQSARKDSWLARRGSILERAGRVDEARVAYVAALASLNNQALHVRQTKASLALITQLQSDISRLTRRSTN